MDAEKLKSLGLQPGPLYAQLKQGKSVTVPGSGVVVTPEEVIGKPKRGRKVVILGDTCDTYELKHLSANADLVVHEATMENSLRTKAIEYGHSTPSMAAGFAMDIKAKKLILTHVSPRYKPVSKEKGPKATGDKVNNLTDFDEDTAQILLDEAKDFMKQANFKSCKVAVAEDFFEDTIDRPSPK